MLEISRLMFESRTQRPSQDLHSASSSCYFSGDPEKPWLYKQRADTCSTSVPSVHVTSETLLVLVQLPIFCVPCQKVCGSWLSFQETKDSERSPMTNKVMLVVVFDGVTAENLTVLDILIILVSLLSSPTIFLFCSSIREAHGHYCILLRSVLAAVY